MTGTLGGVQGGGNVDYAHGGGLHAGPVLRGRLWGEGMRIAVVAARFNELVTGRLVEGALAALSQGGVRRGRVPLVWVPGAFELPLAAARLASGGEVDGVVCLGAVVRGNTDHYVHVAGQCAAGLARVQLDTGVPVAFGVLTTDTLEQALDRAGGKSGNKGAEAALGLIETIDVLRQLAKRDSADEGDR